MAERLCPHEMCSCDLPPDRDYCDPRCAEAESSHSEQESCPCDHSACRPEKARAYDPDGDGPLDSGDVTNG